MNGMVTNNIRDLATGHGVYAFLLNPQGGILGDMNVYNLGETLEVETDRSQLEKILATFDHYIIMDDVEVTNISEEWTALRRGGTEVTCGAEGCGDCESLSFGRCRSTLRSANANAIVSSAPWCAARMNGAKATRSGWRRKMF